jgi:hypothetical protein
MRHIAAAASFKRHRVANPTLKERSLATSDTREGTVQGAFDEAPSHVGTWDAQVGPQVIAAWASVGGGCGLS